MNFDIENLMLITQAECVQLNGHYNGFNTWNSAEEKKVAIDIIRLQNKLKELGGAK